MIDNYSIQYAIQIEISTLNYVRDWNFSME